MEQIRRTTLMDSVTEELRNAILNGEIGMGERVNESTFTTKLNISRTTFREAMRQLEQAGLLVRDPFRGTFVREFSETEIKDLNNLRGALEVYAAEIIIENGDNKPEKLSALYEIVSRMEGIDPEEDVAQTNELHISFHRTLLDMAGNKLMFTVWNDLAQQFWVAMRLSQLSLVARGEGASFAEAHREIVDVVAAGDVTQIHKIMHKHVS